MFQLPDLKYKYDALEKAIDAQTMEIHHQKHHGSYVNKLNEVIRGTEWEGKELGWLLKNLDILPGKIKTAVRNNGGGHYNHSLFWQIMTGKLTEPTGKLKEAIERDFGSLVEFKEKFKLGAMSRFGSGWVWLCSDNKGSLHICSTANQDNCLMGGYDAAAGMPAVEGSCGMKACNHLMNLDVWEHAYYLRYQNRRADYVDVWWQVVDWDEVGKNYESAIR